MSPNEDLNNVTSYSKGLLNIILIQPQNSTAKESNATFEIESTWKERPKSTWPAHVLTCSSHVMSYHMSQLRYQLAVRDMPLQKLSGVAILVSLQECGFSRI